MTAVTALAALSACTTTPPPPPPAVAPPAAAPVVKAPDAKPDVPRPSVASIKLLRPAQGTTLTTFNGTTAKGIDIGGKAGDPIYAAADGRVSYVGKHVRSYGNMIIITHGSVFLTAYAHNGKMLVKENEAVRQGQKIAEMGDSGTNRVKLHFELRRNGGAINPQPYF